MQCWGVRRPCVLIAALSGRMVCELALINIVFAGDGAGGQPIPGGAFFFADPGVGSDERKQHKVDVGLRIHTKRRGSHTVPRDCLVTV